jgi:hypothetical protein
MPQNRQGMHGEIHGVLSIKTIHCSSAILNVPISPTLTASHLTCRSVVRGRQALALL